MSSHHAARPAVDAPKNRQWKDSYRFPRIRTQGRAHDPHKGPPDTPGASCRPPPQWRTSHLQLCARAPEFGHPGRATGDRINSMQ
ncbi:hypothetical protein C6Y14_35600 [Streptomyces dioscori]|uniref:Uncharacterized protein n=1 Tax=Streptomyces dioscori TaxID=2109333 RepID=A0A2P8PWW6_9ACTN|nr:hypothetical protein C6Y14_35600 [Streptomyces dioscori]